MAAGRATGGERKRKCRSALQLAVAALTAALLSACAQSSVVGDRPASSAAVRQAAPQQTAEVAPKPSTRSSRSARNRRVARTQSASDGLASYYSQGERTASGEKFNAGELTAAHPTLPFGTRVRVTNVATGRSVTVRINDRGPFVNGRVIDVSHSAAQSLGMVGQGVARVKLDVVQ